MGSGRGKKKRGSGPEGQESKAHRCLKDTGPQVPGRQASPGPTHGGCEAASSGQEDEHVLSTLRASALVLLLPRGCHGCHHHFCTRGLER